ncbi:hypothetical protein F2Q69_00027863 [Brassica cretica]|uniref:Uncharacterized protein n=1 Tax=Brassica cretica TaxID=69181 RepID=A0A8S9S5Z7_BRACR|nr:hypothetical protein F2Q69_00027863 [Brassica cretica]
MNGLREHLTMDLAVSIAISLINHPANSATVKAWPSLAMVTPYLTLDLEINLENWNKRKRGRAITTNSDQPPLGHHHTRPPARREREADEERERGELREEREKKRGCYGFQSLGFLYRVSLMNETK